MTGMPTADESDAAKAVLQANVEEAARKQAGSSTGDVVGRALDIAGNVAVEGVGEVVGAAIGPMVVGIGSAATATGEAVVTVIGGLFEGLSS